VSAQVSPRSAEAETEQTVTTVREYDPERDEAQLRALFVELQEFERQIEGELLPGEEIAAPYLELMFSRCAKWAGKVFVAELDGELAGFVSVWGKVPPDEPDQDPREQAYISDLVVHSRCRGRGVGRDLMGAAQAYARSCGATVIGVGVLAGNSVARELYRSEGFREYLLQLKKEL
jgi:ribosomal protein S18 acetylase RimI-like enzyme